MFPDPRADRRYPCQLSVVGASAVAFVGTVLDLSVSGLRLTTTSLPPEPGSHLHLDFTLPTGRVEAVAEVRRVTTGPDGVELGVRFTRITADSIEAIREAIRPRSSSAVPRLVRGDD